MDTTPSPRLYRLETFRDDFLTGHRKDGSQAFLGLQYPDILAIFFDAEGNYLECVAREISQEAMDNLKYPDANAWNDAICQSWEEMEAWAEELGITEGVIAMRKFFIPEEEVGILDLPPIFQQMIDRGDEFNQDEQDAIEYWKECNLYTWIWGRDYEVDINGHIVST